MSEQDVSGPRLLREAGRTYAAAGLGLTGALILLAAAGWPRSTISTPEAVLNGLCLGLTEATVLLNGYLWIGRRISASPRYQDGQLPRKTAGWIWAAYQGAALPLAVAQHRLRRGELGTILALVLITGQELLLRAIQTALTPTHQRLGIGVSVAIGIALAVSPWVPRFHWLFAVLQGTLMGLLHGLVFTITGSLAAVVTATAASYLVLKRI